MSDYAYGYLPNPAATAAFVATLPHATLSAAAPHLVRGAEDRDAFVWRALAQCLGEPRIHARNQGSVGSCVGHGSATAVDLTMACEIVLERQPEEWRARVAADALYGESRQVTDNLGNWDGSYGAAAAQAIRDCGTLHMLAYDDAQVDLRSYSANRCRQWAAHGLSAGLLQLAAAHKMHATTLVATAEEARAALQNGYGISVCSGQGFASTRDADGFAPAQGTWSHCMALVGYRAGRRRGFLVVNSWGDDWISGPVYPDDMPHGSFWAEWEVIDRMLRGRDSFAYASYDGFPARALDFLNAFSAWS